jgi:ATP-binding cassette subfamily B protein
LLDEPTSALDPVIESEIYQKYNEITKGKTVVFVSHRLASTRFCDRILYLKNGQIVEQGSHEDLLELNGEYTKMYQTQAQYYK